MFGPAGQTQYDLNFSLFGIPVRVHPFFWIIGMLLGQHELRLGLDFLLGWVVVFFISILVHELGHALAAAYFGFRPQIWLYGMGGMAQYAPMGRYNRAHSLTITLAGPAAGFFLAAVGLVVSQFVDSEHPLLPLRTWQLLMNMLSSLIQVNIFWSILNLFPVLPLDGGQVCRDVLTYVDHRRGLVWTHWIGVFVGGAIGALFLSFGAIWGAIIFLMMAYQNYQALQMTRWR